MTRHAAIISPIRCYDAKQARHLEKVGCSMEEFSVRCESSSSSATKLSHLSDMATHCAELMRQNDVASVCSKLVG